MAPKRPFIIYKDSGKVQITLGELKAVEDFAGEHSYQELGATKSVQKLDLAYTISGAELVPVYAQIGELLPMYLEEGNLDMPEKLRALAEMQFNELGYGFYDDILKLKNGTYFRALANLNLKDVRYNTGDIINEKALEALDDHYQNKFAPMILEVSDKVPKTAFEVGQPLSIKVGWRCKANISTSDDIRFEKDEIYSDAEMEKCPGSKKYKFERIGKPEVAPEDTPAKPRRNKSAYNK